MAKFYLRDPKQPSFKNKIVTSQRKSLNRLKYFKASLVLNAILIGSIVFLLTNN